MSVEISEGVPLLEIRDLAVSFGAAPAVKRISFCLLYTSDAADE